MNQIPLANAAGAPSALALSVCIIGRNEGRHLAQCAASLALLSQAGIAYESIFVDSASSDDSASIAGVLFDTLIELQADPNLNAGAARYAATTVARGHWILYLDADMELLPSIVGTIAALVNGADRKRGLCGYTVNHYSDGTSDRIRYSGNRDGQPCCSFGGAVLLPRLAVLAAGNWPTQLFAYEETELYSRIDHGEVRVIWNELDFVKHKTPKIAYRAKLTGLIFPAGSYLGKKYYGAGQVTRLTLLNGNFMRFFRIKPWAYLILASLAMSLATLPFTPYAWLMLIAVSLAIIAVKGVKSFFVYCCWLPQMALGCARLERAFVPTVVSVTDPETRDARIARRGDSRKQDVPI